MSVRPTHISIVAIHPLTISMIGLSYSNNLDHECRWFFSTAKANKKGLVKQYLINLNQISQ